MSSVATAHAISPSPSAAKRSTVRPSGFPRGVRVVDADELEVGLAERDDAVRRPEPVVLAAGHAREAVLVEQLRGGGIEVGDGDEDMVEARASARIVRRSAEPRW